MAIRSMTGFAQVKGQAGTNLAFSLSLKSVNHRFLDVHFRMPSSSDALEMKLRRILKDKIARGHVELTLSLERGEGNGFALNRELVGGYVQAFRAAAEQFGVSGEPDLNAILRIPGAMDTATLPADEEVESAVLAKVEELLARLNEMREEEGRGIERELRERMARVDHARIGVGKHRGAVLQSYLER